jgi:hypothetical protein
VVSKAKVSFEIHFLHSTKKNILTGNDNPLPVFLGESIGICLDLRKNEVVCGSGFAALQRLTTAGKDGQTLVQGILGLSGNFDITFALSTAFRVSNNDPLNSHIGEHIGTSFTSEGAISLDPAILGTNSYIGAKALLNALKVDLRGANNNLSLLSEGHLVQHGNKFLRLRHGSIAFPVSTHEKLASFGASRGMEAPGGSLRERRSNSLGREKHNVFGSKLQDYERTSKKIAEAIE